MRPGFATPIRRDAVVCLIGGGITVGAIVVTSPAVALLGAAIFGAGVYDAFDKGVGVRGKRRV